MFSQDGFIWILIHSEYDDLTVDKEYSNERGTLKGQRIIIRIQTKL